MLKKLRQGYALGIVMSVESSIKQTILDRGILHYAEREKVAKFSVLKGGQLVIDSLMYRWIKAIKPRYSNKMSL
jgi:hypothetical protein